VILFFEMGAKLPAKLVAIEQKRIIAAALSFICTPHKRGCICRKPRSGHRVYRSRSPKMIAPSRGKDVNARI